MRLRLLASSVLATVVLTTSGCGVIMRFIGDRVADAITQKTADLSNASIQAMFTTNLYPLDAKTIETEVAGDKGWAAGTNLVNVNVLKRAGIGMWEIDGTVTAKKAGGPAQPLTYFGKGAYFLPLAPNDRAPRTIEIRTASGQVASFTVKPAAPIKIKAVNGKAAGASVDLAKDLVIDLDDPGQGKLKVALIATTLGIRTMTDLAVCKAAKRLVIPAAAYKHMGVSASAAGIVGVDAGANYVLVERYDAAPVKAGPVGAAFTVGRAWAHAPVTVVGDAKNAAALTVSGEVQNPRGALTYTASKPQAFSGPPLARMRKVALGHLGLRAVLFKQSSNTSESRSGNVVTITTTTTTLAFPKVDPSHWDRLLDTAAGGLGGVLGGLGGNAAMLPPERVTGQPLYATLDVPNDEVGEKFVERTYRKTRPVFPTSAGSAFASISSTFALDRPIVRLMTDAGADAILSASVDLQIGTQKGGEKLVLVPRLSYSIIGPANGYTVGPTTYASGNVSASDGVTFTKAELENPDALRRIARLDDMMGGLRAALGQLRDAERAAGYEAIWALQ